MDILGALAFAMLMAAQFCAVVAAHERDRNDVPGGGAKPEARATVSAIS